MPKRKSAAAEAAQPLPAEEAVPPVAASTAPSGPSPEGRKRPPFPDVSEQ
jgi:hypothetical protein